MTNRTPKYFTPSSKDQPLTDAHEALPLASPQPDFSGLKLNRVPLKGLRTLLYSTVLLVLVMGLWQAIDIYQRALATHWLIAAGFLGLIGMVSAAALRTLWQFLRGRRTLKRLDNLTQQAQRLSNSVDLGNAQHFIEQLRDYYQGTPQDDFLIYCLNSLPDYSNDGEVINHIERTFLASLDQEASARISKFSLQTALGVSLSPWITLDLALALWRNVKMIDEVAQVYGIRPSLATRFKLLRKVLQQLVYVGVTEAAIDQFYDEFSLDILTGLSAARGLQGLGAGVYAVRIGLAAMNVCRPIAFNPDNKPKFAKIASAMVAQAKALITRKKA